VADLVALACGAALGLWAVGVVAGVVGAAIAWWRS